MLAGIATDSSGEVYLAGATRATCDFGGAARIEGDVGADGVGFVVKLKGGDGSGIHATRFVAPGTAASIGNLAIAGDVIAVTGFYFNALSYESTSGPKKEEDGNAAFVARIDPGDGKVRWLKRALVPSTQVGFGGVTVDATANVYIGASFNGPIDGWDSPSPAGTGYSALLESFDGASGAVRWKKVIGRTGSEGIDVSSVHARAGVLAMAGVTPPQVDFGNGKVVGTSGLADPFVATFDYDGGLRWARTFGNDQSGSDDEYIKAIGVDDWGQILAVGRYRRSLVIDGEALPTPEEDLDTAGFGIKLDKDGTLVWAKAVLSSSWAAGESVFVGPSGRSVATFAISGAADLGANVKPNAPSGGKSLGVVGWTP